MSDKATTAENQELTALLALQQSDKDKVKRHEGTPLEARVKREAEERASRVKALQAKGAKPIT